MSKGEKEIYEMIDINTLVMYYIKEARTRHMVGEMGKGHSQSTVYQASWCDFDL